MRPHGLRTRPHRQLPHLRRRRCPAEGPQVPGGLRRAARDEFHGRRRQDHPRIEQGRCAAARVHRSLHRGVSRGCGGAGARDSRAAAAGHRQREHHGDGRDDRRAREAGAHVSERRIGLLQDLDVSRVRPSRAARSLRDQERRACRQRQVREGRRPRFRVVEGEQAGRACLGRRLRRRPSRVAHRVLGDGAPPAGCADRSACRRRRSDFSASRERDRAERGRDRPARSRASGCTSST